jgi:hypothetical protein
MYTRRDYLNKKCTHREYYAQFVTTSYVNSVASKIGLSRLLKSEDPDFNDIPLREWDMLPIPVGTHSLMISLEDYLTMAGAVSMSKEAARQAVEKHKGESNE